MSSGNVSEKQNINLLKNVEDQMDVLSIGRKFNGIHFLFEVEIVQNNATTEINQKSSSI